jgi:2-polyprenyl-6-methoxyphenol hydroxylase-like FAD-dependent oxidoreductase
MISNTSPATTPRRVVIVGGGVAGLSLARALKNAGHSPLVIERSPEWPATGTADYLPANAVRALHRLGIGDDVAATAHPISRQRVTGTRGRTLVDLPVSSIWGEGASCTSCCRRPVAMFPPALAPRLPHVSAVT